MKNDDEVIFLAKDENGETSVFSTDGKSIKSISIHNEYPKEWKENFDRASEFINRIYPHPYWKK